MKFSRLEWMIALHVTAGIAGHAAPATIQFVSATNVVRECSGFAAITVEIDWLDPFEPPVYEVHYRTSNETAIAGDDYAAQEGILSFEYPETNRTFHVPVLNDTAIEGDETLRLTLSEPSFDAQLGANSNAVLIIRDNEDPMPAAPAGALQRWWLREALPSKSLLDVAYGSGMFVAVGYEGTILISPDGHCWQEARSGTANHLYAVVYGAGQFVAAGSGGHILVSHNGIDWTVVSTGQPTVYELPTWWYDVAWGGGMFVAVGWRSVGVSQDGLNWDFRVWMDNDGPFSLTKVVWGNDRFVASPGVWVSMDGKTWTDFSSSELDGFSSLVFARGRFAGIAYDFKGCGAPEVCYYDNYRVMSEDGRNWTIRSEKWNGYYGWEEVYAYGTFLSVRHNPCLCSFCDCSGPTNHVWTSTDGVGWSYRSSFGSSGISVCAGNHSFVAVGGDGTIFQSDPVIEMNVRSLGAHVELSISGPTNRHYVIESVDALEDTWTPRGTMVGHTDPFLWRDEKSLESKRRFYRALLLP